MTGFAIKHHFFYDLSENYAEIVLFIDNSA